MFVTLRPLEEDEPEDEAYLLAESAEERAPGVRTITTTSPLGKALLGANLEDRIAYEAPGGTFHYLVVAFEPRRLEAEGAEAEPARGAAPAGRR